MNSSSDASNRRLFVPLATEPYDWFRFGLKTWELRRAIGQFRSDRLTPGMIVELRKGYSNKESSIWGTVVRTEVADSLMGFFQRVAFSEVIPEAQTEEEAAAIASGILALDPFEVTALVGIRIRLEQSRYLDGEHHE